MPTLFLPDLPPITPHDRLLILLGIVGLAFILASTLRYVVSAVVADLRAYRRDRINLRTRTMPRPRPKAA
jgi:hypothetical protein